ncbi:aspartyl-phosphate phosphatase Spo0E family protein [Clostridium intestinale]|nr:aspartyl-phosphate phosphatase Spo0E family protein [Clostridium intestinale]WRY54004.1 aspartyl-phosphate phosphatase Spo0E family protein [Clostridium intestinale]
MGEVLRKELNDLVAERGLLDPEVIKKSQELDEIIVIEQREKLGWNK